MRRLLAAWRKRREHQRKMKHFFALMEEETVSLQDTMIALAEVYADAMRMAQGKEDRPA